MGSSNQTMKGCKNFPQNFKLRGYIHAGDTEISIYCKAECFKYSMMNATFS
jgi:hypothetical protein